ncbi:MAG: hypothetical protein JAY74_20820 [Candidatus Thiodiazotropha taylori]|nr:hypothetical protein [Candidatus Thiodiazotropha taylori]
MASTTTTDMYGKYDSYGNPLWTSTSDDMDVTTTKQRFRDIHSISNITSTYIKDARENIKNDPAAQAQILSSLFSVKEYLQDGKDPADIPSLQEIQEALELKQKLAKAEEQYIKKFQEGFYINPKEGTIRYFDPEAVDYRKTRKVTPFTDAEMLIYPVEHKTVDGTYSIYTVQLPRPEFAPENADKHSVIAHELVGYTEIPQMGVGINEMDARVIAFGCGKIPLGSLDHYDTWCYQAQETFNHNGNIPDYNDLVFLMRDNATNIKYDPYEPGCYTPLVPCKGVYSRQTIKKKYRYSSEYRNESVYQTFTGIGTTYNVKDPHTGIGIICYEDTLNIVGAHRCYGQQSDYQSKAMLTKLYLILRPVKVEKEDDDETWGDIWDMVLREQLASDVEYTGSMTLGPNFNPRPENVEVINITVPMEHERISETERTDTYMADQHTEMAEKVKELYPLHHSDNRTSAIPPDQPPSTEADESIAPKENESIIEWAKRNNHLTDKDADAFKASFKDTIELFAKQENDPSKITSSELMTLLSTAFDTNLMSRKRSERMFYAVQENVNPYSRKLNGMGYQLVYDHRFRPFVDSKLYHSQTLLTYASEGLNESDLSNVLNFENLVATKAGPSGNQRDIKVFSRHGDLLRTMFGKVENGKTFSDLIYMASLFVEYYSMKLAELPLKYPTYAYLMENGAPVNWRSPEGVLYTPTFTDTELATFMSPETDIKQRAYDSLLTWHVLTSLILSYIKHDRTDLKGTQASELAENFLGSIAIQKVKTCNANLASGAAYFDKFADSPLLCQYGQIGGLNPRISDYFIKRENFIPVQDNFKGGLLIKYSHKVRSDVEDPDPDFYRNVMRFDRDVYQYWTFLTMTWSQSMVRTEIGRNLLEWNEIFRGESLYQDFFQAFGTHKFTDSIGNHVQSNKVVNVPQDTNVQQVLGMKNPGPIKELTLQKILATHDLMHEANYKSVLAHDRDGLMDWWQYYYNMFAKCAMWSSQFVFSNYIAPNHTPWETHDGDQESYDPVKEYNVNNLHTFVMQNPADVKSVTKYNYYPHSDPLSTTTFNLADYVLSAGDFTTKGSGMLFINPIVPKPDFQWYNSQTDGFKKLFIKQGGEWAWNYMTAMRPFGKYLWINDVEVDLHEYMKRPYFLLGNRFAYNSVAELED